MDTISRYACIGLCFLCLTASGGVLSAQPESGGELMDKIDNQVIRKLDTVIKNEERLLAEIIQLKEDVRILKIRVSQNQ